MMNRSLIFLTNEESFKESIIDEEEHLSGLQNEDTIQGNYMHKAVRTLEGMFDLQSKLQKIDNVNMNSSSMQHELFNLGSEAEPKMSIWENVARLEKDVSSSSCFNNTKTSSPGCMKI